MTEERNKYGWYFTFEAPNAGETALQAAQRALDVLEADQYMGRKRYLVSHSTGHMEFVLWTLYLQAAGIEVHFAHSDELTGYEEVYVSVYNTTADLVGFPSTHARYDFNNWLAKSMGNWYPELVEERKVLLAKYDQLRCGAV